MVLMGVGQRHRPHAGHHPAHLDEKYSACDQYDGKDPGNGPYHDLLLF